MIKCILVALLGSTSALKITAATTGGCHPTGPPPQSAHNNKMFDWDSNTCEWIGFYAPNNGTNSTGNSTANSTANTTGGCHPTGPPPQSAHNNKMFDWDSNTCEWIGFYAPNNGTNSTANSTANTTGDCQPTGPPPPTVPNGNWDTNTCMWRERCDPSGPPPQTGLAMMWDYSTCMWTVDQYAMMNNGTNSTANSTGNSTANTTGGCHPTGPPPQSAHNNKMFDWDSNTCEWIGFYAPNNGTNSTAANSNGTNSNGTYSNGTNSTANTTATGGMGSPCPHGPSGNSVNGITCS